MWIRMIRKAFAGGAEPAAVGTELEVDHNTGKILVGCGKAEEIPPPAAPEPKPTRTARRTTTRATTPDPEPDAALPLLDVPGDLNTLTEEQENA